MKTWLGMAMACGLLGGCGGGGCEKTGEVEFVYTPKVSTAAGSALTYQLGSANSWTLQVRGVSSECLKGLSVTVPSDRVPLPSVVTLDAATGELKTGVLASHIEGYCTIDNGSIVGGSVNRSCPAGQEYNDHVHALLITTDHVNNQSRVLTPITFQPAQ